MRGRWILCLTLLVAAGGDDDDPSTATTEAEEATTTEVEAAGPCAEVFRAAAAEINVAASAQELVIALRPTTQPPCASLSEWGAALLTETSADVEATVEELAHLVCSGLSLRVDRDTPVCREAGVEP